MLCLAECWVQARPGCRFHSRVRPHTLDNILIELFCVYNSQILILGLFKKESSVLHAAESCNQNMMGSGKGYMVHGAVWCGVYQIQADTHYAVIGSSFVWIKEETEGWR